MSDLEIQLSEIPETSSLDVEYDFDEIEEVLDVSDFSVADIKFSARLNRAGETVRIKAQVSFELSYQCGKCLETQTVSRGGEQDFVLISQSKWRKEYDGDEIELDPSDLDVEVYLGDVVDLKPLLRESVLDVFPDHAVCTPDRSEVCDATFKAMIGDEAVADLEEAKVDLRWGPLMELRKKMD